jgi:hypothetical protein
VPREAGRGFVRKILRNLQANARSYVLGQKTTQLAEAAVRQYQDKIVELVLHTGRVERTGERSRETMFFQLLVVVRWLEGMPRTGTAGSRRAKRRGPASPS